MFPHSSVLPFPYIKRLPRFTTKHINIILVLHPSCIQCMSTARYIFIAQWHNTAHFILGSIEFKISIQSSNRITLNNSTFSNSAQAKSTPSESCASFLLKNSINMFRCFQWSISIVNSHLCIHSRAGTTSTVKLPLTTISLI